MPAARGRNAGKLWDRGRLAGRKHDVRHRSGARRRGIERSVAGADAMAPFVVRGVVVVATVVGGFRCRCRRSEIGSAGMDGLKRDASHAGRPGEEEESEQRQLPEARDHPGKLALCPSRG